MIYDIGREVLIARVVRPVHVCHNLSTVVFRVYDNNDIKLFLQNNTLLCIVYMLGYLYVYIFCMFLYMVSI